MYLDALADLPEDQRDILVERMREKGLQRLQNDGLYAFCTEDIACYLPALKAEGGRCLTVAASGDQAVNLLMAGAEEVVAFDVVPEAGYLLDLKMAALAAAGDDPGEFRGRFLDRLSPEGFRPLKQSLGGGTKDFVDAMALLTTDFGLVAFRPFLITGKNAYIVDEGSFARAKAAVARAREGNRVSFLCADLRTVPFAPGIGTFDAICLSNVIQDVVGGVARGAGKPGDRFGGRTATFALDDLVGLVGSMVWPLARLLRPGGTMMAAYVFSADYLDDEDGCDDDEPADEDAEAAAERAARIDFERMSLKNNETRKAAFEPPPGFVVEEIRTDGRNSNFDGRDDVAVIVRRLP